MPFPEAPRPRMTAREVPYRDLIGRMVRSSLQVGFMHCDPYGHMNTAKYLEAAIHHRMTEVDRLIGLDVMRLRRERGLIYITRKVEIDFMDPALPGEWLWLDSWVEDVTASYLRVMVRFSKRDNGKNCAKVTFTSATYNERKGILVKIPETYPCDIPQLDLEAMPWAPGHPRAAVAS